MKYPKFLQKGDTIGITAPSDGNRKEMDYQRLDLAVKKMENLGYVIRETKNVRTSDGRGRSSEKTERAEQLMSLITDPGSVLYLFSQRRRFSDGNTAPFGFSENPGKSDLVSGIFGQYRTYVYHYDIV